MFCHKLNAFGQEKQLEQQADERIGVTHKWQAIYSHSYKCRYVCMHVDTYWSTTNGVYQVTVAQLGRLRHGAHKYSKKKKNISVPFSVCLIHQMHFLTKLAQKMLIGSNAANVIATNRSYIRIRSRAVISKQALPTQKSYKKNRELND